MIRIVKDGIVHLYPLRVSGAYYHHRIGANRERAGRERRGSPELSEEERFSPARARDRRLLEEGKRQLWHEILAHLRLFADRHGDGRDFVVIFEQSSGGGVGGRAHRKPACTEFQNFLAQFVLVGTMSGYNTSQFSSRCGHRIKYGNNREIRTKVCEQCRRPGAATDSKRPFYFDDRDINAGVNFMLIDEAEARGKCRPERFQSLAYKKKIEEGATRISPQAAAQL